MLFERLRLSAPGKIILCGEHAVVYGTKALACAINQRTHLDASKATEAESKEFVLELTDIGQTLRVDQTTFVNLIAQQAEAQSHDDLIQELSAKNSADSKQLLALKLLVALLGEKIKWEDLRQLKVSINSDLPLSSGLGSSASFSVCLAAFMLLASGTIRIPDHTNATFTLDQLEQINQFTFLVEKIFHGNPSGIDNTVTTFGQYILFEKGKIVNKFSSNMDLSVLVINSGIPKQTKEQVAKVRELYNRHPPVMESIINAIGCLVTKFASILDSGAQSPQPAGSPESYDQVCDSLNELIRINQGLLCSMQISNPSLDEIVHISASFGRGFSCKITGAGGGGCCFVLLDKSRSGTESLDRLKEQLREKGYETFKTELGCGGIRVDELLI